MSSDLVGFGRTALSHREHSEIESTPQVVQWNWGLALDLKSPVGLVTQLPLTNLTLVKLHISMWKCRLFSLAPWWKNSLHAIHVDPAGTKVKTHTWRFWKSHTGVTESPSSRLQGQQRDLTLNVFHQGKWNQERARECRSTTDQESLLHCHTSAFCRPLCPCHCCFLVRHKIRCRGDKAYITQDSSPSCCTSCWIWKSNQPCWNNPLWQGAVHGLHYTEYHKAWAAVDNPAEGGGASQWHSARTAANKPKPNSLTHKIMLSQAVLKHTFNLSIWKVEAGGSLWS